jgi:AhpD family alkylhydroperoxidase
MRLNYIKQRPELANHLFGLGKELGQGLLPEPLRELVAVRISQMNQCSFCLHTHIKKALSAGVPQKKIDLLSNFWELDIYDDKEKAALYLAESITTAGDSHVPDQVYDQAAKIFSEDELIELVYLSSLMNAWNRLSITFRTPIPN